MQNSLLRVLEDLMRVRHIDLAAGSSGSSRVLDTDTSELRMRWLPSHSTHIVREAVARPQANGEGAQLGMPLASRARKAPLRRLNRRSSFRACSVSLDRNKSNEKRWRPIARHSHLGRWSKLTFSYVSSTVE